MISLADFSPAELGLPERFEQFRPCQIEAAETVLNSEKRFVGLALPTGSGKSLAALAMARASGLRTVILTATKGLQQQYLETAPGLVVDIRGKANYQCRDQKNLSCRFGPYEGCRCAGGRGCTYETARDIAREAPNPVANYAYWIRAAQAARMQEFSRAQTGIEPPDGSLPVEMLILDEAHAAVEQLSQALRVSLRESWLVTLGLKTYPRDDNFSRWVNWAEKAGVVAGIGLKQAISELKERPSKQRRDVVYELEELAEALGRISRMREDQWVLEMRQGTQWGRVWGFDCVWPGQWAESNLFCGVEKVVLMSATLRPNVFSMLGVGKEDVEFREWPRVFPAQNTPIYHLPTVRLNHKTSDEDLDYWVRRIDEVISSRISRKGLIHTVSYARQQYLCAHSQFGREMVANTSDPESETAVQIVQRFKQMPAPAILVSPTFATGWDFPGEEVEWIIVAKLPYPDSRSKVMKARTEKSPLYPHHLCMQSLVQSCGRATRSATDRTEVFIVDDSIGWFMKQHRGLAPRWFEVARIGEIPPPLTRAGIGLTLT